MQKNPFSFLCLLAFMLLCVVACSPTFDWREVRGVDVPFVVLMPEKPVSQSQPVDLDGLHVDMTMTAAEINGTVFAVGAAHVPAAADVTKALIAMKTAMVKNIDGTLHHEKSSAGKDGNTLMIEISATGHAHTDKRKRLLNARFIARGDRVYQVVVLGVDHSVSPETIDMFLDSFHPG